VLAASPALAVAQPLGSRALSVGMRGPDVRTLQVDLTMSGFVTTPTAYFSRGTRNHVISFQRRYGLAADGVVGSLTAGRLVAVAKAKSSKGNIVSAATAGSGAAGLSSTTTTSSTTSKPSSAKTKSTTTTTTTSTTSTTTTSSNGGAGMGQSPNGTPVENATIVGGLAVPPPNAPPAIAELIAAANRIAFLPYIYGGGHADYQGNPVALDSGYDCSGSVSFALHGAGMLSEPLDSTEFETWGSPGAGSWITLWANGGHVYMNVAGLYFDTAAQGYSNNNDRWSTTRISPASGFVEVHPTNW
jgi:peptidoglycan hydrolase-like protein with peptidoglycan-binding domain